MVGYIRDAIMKKKPFHSFWGVFLLNSQRLFLDENNTINQNLPPINDHFTPKDIISP